MPNPAFGPAMAPAPICGSAAAPAQKKLQLKSFYKIVDDFRYKVGKKI